MSTGWKNVALEEVCDFLDRRGITPEKLGSRFFSDGFRVISAKNIKGRNIDITAGEQRFVDESTYQRWMTSPLLVDDVILTSEAPLGEPAYIAQELKWCLGQRLFGIRSNKSKLYGRFLFYAFQASPVRDDMLSRATGATAQGIRQSELRKIKLPLPPLTEQQRIVAVLDQAFKAIACARANVEQNRLNAHALFESYLQTVFSQRTQGWVEKSLGEMATFRNGVNFTKTSKGEAIKILGVKDFKNHYWARLDSLESIIPDGILPEADTLHKNDIVFVRSNGNPELIGRCLLIGEINDRITFSGFTIRARQLTGEILPQYLCHFLKSSHVRRELVEGGSGANIRSLNQGALSRLRINFPAEIGEQYRIIEQLETLQAETQRLESLYQRKIDALDELKQSLLHQAFSGQL
ncbi:TPA: restriction endonuclease subunit S [Citrobacter braakii]|uniref:restriction endonuclease subunit S n=1 Tax=Citrobacter freundii TaxID=546 RepID=UPI0035A83FEF|nr:restriction endonuclease subunit S [Citrobacter braakii]